MHALVFFSLITVSGWWMSVARLATRDGEQNVCVALDVSQCVLSGGLSAHRCWGASASDKSSPPSPAFDDLQRHKHKWTWVIFFFYACQRPLEWLASWVIRHEVSCRSALTSRRTPLTAPVWCTWQSHFCTCVLCSRAPARCQGGSFPYRRRNGAQK